MPDDLSLRLTSGLGLVLILLTAWALSSHKARVPWRVVLGGLGLQIALGLLFFRTTVGVWFYEATGVVFGTILASVEEGAKFVFGETYGDHYFAFFVLPSIVFFGALSAVLEHWGVIPAIVRALGWALQKALGVSGAESLAAAANVLAGQTEAPLLIRRYLDRMTDSELMSVMTGGFATVAGGVLVAYYGMGIDPGQLLTASLLSAPAALVLAKLMRPETDVPETAGGAAIDRPAAYHNTLDAAAGGAAEGAKLAINVGAMMLAFLGLIALVNIILGAAGGAVGLPDLSLERLLGWAFWPVAWALGTPIDDCPKVAELLGKKTVLNEFIAYYDLSQLSDEDLSPRGRMIAVYALCGFANLSSVGIQMGALAFLAPNRRASVAALAMKAMVAGTLAAFMTACIAGMLADPAERLIPAEPVPAEPVPAEPVPAEPAREAPDDGESRQPEAQAEAE
ncbi:NupC/NupG family nucleoside CNT transporter [Alienimonas chondri]|uniref:Nucleoside permease NupX n=1 Tax=Alienimonas chondri TaxID=2681879 RepID=A0ABX1VLL4_9PLAN|nr:nucleoside transporter C-terminal domain-containing protein [Alienimonas chondri]NNJ27887.1 putative nucleoside permease NupX [Alienimonas chondri]